MGAYIGYIFILLFIVLEFLFKDKKFPFLRKGFWIDIVWFSFLQGIILQFAAFQFISQFYDQYGVNLVTGLPIVFQVLITILSIELIAYWVHRLNHSWLPMWRLHEVHHTSLELNWLSANRIHFLEIVFDKGCWWSNNCLIRSF